MSKRSIGILLVIVLFIPLVVAIIAAFGVDPYTPSIGSLSTVSVTAPDGNTYQFGEDENDVLSLYSSLTSGAKQVDEAILTTLGLENTKPYEVTYADSGSQPLSFKLYLSENEKDCVYVTPEGKYYLIEPSVAKKLIVREEFSSIDTSGIFPQLTASGIGSPLAISFTSCEWTYKALDGEIKTLKNTSAPKNPTVKFNKEDGTNLNLSFDKQPDTLKLVIKNSSGETLFNDNYSNLSAANLISFNHDERLTLEAFAEWIKKDTVDYHGTATYNFDILFDIVPTYRIVDTKPLPVGEFTVLRMSDFNDGEMLTVESDIGLASQIKAYDLKGENVKIALIPYGATLSAGEHTLTLKTDAGQTDTVSIKVREPRDNEIVKEQTIIIDDTAYPSLNEAFTKESVDEFNALITKLTNESSDEMLYEGRFEYPTGSSKVVKGGGSYGMKRNIMSKSSTDVPYVSSGHDLECYDGQEIKAANNGKVVFAGTTVLRGNTVVVDHGYGILTVYGNLGSISVAVGDSVTKSETVVGKAGSTGFACVLDGAAGKLQVMTHYAVSMNGIFVAPKSVYNGIHF